MIFENKRSFFIEIPLFYFNIMIYQFGDYDTIRIFFFEISILKKCFNSWDLNITSKKIFLD